MLSLPIGVRVFQPPRDIFPIDFYTRRAGPGSHSVMSVSRTVARYRVALYCPVRELPTITILLSFDGPTPGQLLSGSAVLPVTVRIVRGRFVGDAESKITRVFVPAATNGCVRFICICGGMHKIPQHDYAPCSTRVVISTVFQYAIYTFS